MHLYLSDLYRHVQDTYVSIRPYHSVQRSLLFLQSLQGPSHRL